MNKQKTRGDCEIRGCRVNTSEEEDELLKTNTRRTMSLSSMGAEIVLLYRNPGNLRGLRFEVSLWYSLEVVKNADDEDRT